VVRKVTFNQYLKKVRVTTQELREKYSERGNSKCKGPEAGTSW